MEKKRKRESEKTGQSASETEKVLNRHKKTDIKTRECRDLMVKL